MSQAMWPTVAWVGAWIALVGGIIAVIGIPAAVVRNERIADALILYSGGPLVMLGAVVLILGVGGWWVVAGVVVLAAFGWLIRPRPHGDTP